MYVKLLAQPSSAYLAREQTRSVETLPMRGRRWRAGRQQTRGLRKRIRVSPSASLLTLNETAVRGCMPRRVLALRRRLERLLDAAMVVLTGQRQALVSVLLNDGETSTEKRILILHGDASDDLASESLAGELATLILVAVAGVEVGLVIRKVSKSTERNFRLPELTCLRKYRRASISAKGVQRSKSPAIFS